MTSVDLLTETPPTPRVSQLAIDIQRALSDVGSGWVEGEVQRRKTVAGHTYFTLADENATIDCVVFRSRAQRISKWPSEGQLVQVHFERVDFYARRGSTSLHVDAIRLTGEGELLARKQATLERLTADGLVARAKRPLPAYPRRVGVIAARASDAKQDVIKALRERWPAVHIVFRPALVEGIRAVDSVIEALAHLQDIDGIDAIILARGGGSVRDLVAFDDERLCRAVFACDVPVITSIGHTAHRPNCDHVSAAYADVPARAAELVVPSINELAADLERRRLALENVLRVLSGYSGDLAGLWERARPYATLRRRDAELDALDARMSETATTFYVTREKFLDGARHALAAGRANVPTPSLLDLPAQQLLSAGRSFFDARSGELSAVARLLTSARERLCEGRDLRMLAERLEPAGTRARRRVGDYERAVSRLRADADRRFTWRSTNWERDLADLVVSIAASARRGLADSQASLGYVDLAVRRRAIDRRLDANGDELARAGEVMATGAIRRVADAERQLGHVVELIAARDFRRLGWVLAGDRDGNPVRSVAELAPGAELALNFQDGRAHATVATIHPIEGATNG